MRIPRRERAKIARELVSSLPDGSPERYVALCLMANFSDIDTRLFLGITKKMLEETKCNLKQMFIDKGF